MLEKAPVWHEGTHNSQRSNVHLNREEEKSTKAAGKPIKFCVFISKLILCYMLRIQKKGKTKVIINADDLGYSQERDEAAFSLIESGIVRSASLIVNMPGSKYAAERCLMMKFRPGLHINLTEGKPLSSINSSLTNTNGNFKPKSYYFSN